MHDDDSASGVRVFWTPALADPDQPTAMDLDDAVDLSDMLSGGCWIGADEPTDPDPNRLRVRHEPVTVTMPIRFAAGADPASVLDEFRARSGPAEISIVLPGRGTERVPVTLPRPARLTVDGLEVGVIATLYAPPVYARGLRHRLLDRRLRPMHTAYTRRLRARRRRSGR